MTETRFQELLFLLDFFMDLTFLSSLDNFLLSHFFQRVVLGIDKEKILGIAQKYILKGQSKKAIKEYLRLIEASPKDKRLYLKLGDLYLKDGDREKAVKEYLKLADLYVEEDLNFRAISIYKKVLSINPKLTEALDNIAKLYLKEGLAGSAKNCYQSILGIKPDDKDALEALKNIEKRQEQRERPKAALPAESLVPKHRHPSEKKHTEERPSSFSPLTMDTPSLPSETEMETPSLDKDLEMHYHLGIAYKEMELFDYAISEFELASSDPFIKFDCCIMLGNCFMEKGNYNKSIEYYKIASEIKGLPDEKLARLHFNLGLAYEANGMVTEALDTFTLALKLDHSLLEAQEKIEKLQQLQK
jgi:tetratricopeptide (TPR) repeat protein